MSEAEVLEPSTELVPIEDMTALAATVEKQPGIVLLDREKYNAWYEKLAADAPRDVDINTHKGREVVRSYAAKIRSEKSKIDKARLQMTEEWRNMVKQANAAGSEIREQLDALAVEVRKPLTEWEDAEKAREAEVERILKLFNTARYVEMGETSDSIRERGTIVHNIAIDPDLFRDRTEEAEKTKSETVAHLFAALKAAEKAEEDRRELERLQKEAAEREEAERQKREAEEAEAQRLADQKAAEEAAQRAKEDEQRKIEAAAEQAKREAEEKAEREREAAEAKRAYARQIIDHIKEVGLGMIGGQPQPYGILLHELDKKIVIDDDMGDLQEEVRAVRDATRAQLEAAMERARLRQEQEEQAEKERKEAEEARIRQENKAHRTAVKTAAKKAIMTCGADEETAQKIVLAMIAGEIPAVTLAF